MGKHLSEFEIGQMIAHGDDANPKKFGEIAKLLHKPKSTIVTAHHRVNRRGYLHRKKGSGPKITTTPRDVRHIKISLRRDPYLSSRNIKDRLNLKQSERTIRRRCVECGLKSYWTNPKPHISDRNKQRRHGWALEHRSWSKYRWRMVNFSEESQF